MSKNKILILGGAGYVGQPLSESFLNKEYEVFIIDNLIYENQKVSKNLINNKNYNLIRKSIKDLNFLINLINSKKIFNIVILSGLVGDPITKKYKKLSKLNNYLYLKNFLTKINKTVTERLVFVSTCSNYGITKNRLADENTKLLPQSSYAKDKVKIEKLIMLKNMNCSKSILRFATAFGVSSRMRFDLTINDFCKKFFEKIFFEVYDPHTWRPYCHIKDFCRAINKVLDADKKKINKQVFNVGSSKNNFRKIDIAKKISKYFKNNNFKKTSKRFDPRDYRVNFNKISKILKFKCTYSIDYGIREIIKILKEKKYNKKDLGNFKIKMKIAC